MKKSRIEYTIIKIFEDYEEGERGEPIGGKSLNTVSITAHLVKAIQELEARIATLEG